MKNGKYTLVVAPKDYPGKRYRSRYCYEHLAIFWAHNGFVPPKGMEIHHLNGDHRDNRIENLKLVSGKEHRQIHSELIKQKTRIKTNCGFCSKQLVVKGNDYRRRKKDNKFSKLFCTRSCGAKHQYSEVAGRS